MRSARDQPVIGVVGADVPREVVLAVGALPVRLMGAPDAVGEPEVRRELRDRSAALLGAVDPVAVDLLASVLDGAAQGLAGIVFSREREAFLRVYYVLRELAETTPTVPPVHLVDMVHLDRPSSRRYDLAQVRRLVGVVERWTERVVTAEALADAVEVCSELRTLLLRAHEQRVEGRLSGTEMLEHVTITDTRPPEEAADAVRRALDVAADRDPLERRRLFVSGSTHYTTTTYAVIEQSGWSVVAEDHAGGLLAVTVQVGSVPRADLDAQLRAIADAYARRGPDGPSASADTRAAWADTVAARTRSDAVLSFVRRHDEAPLWDFPRLKDVVGRRGVAAHLLRDQGALPDALALTAALDTLSAARPAEVAR